MSDPALADRRCPLCGGAGPRRLFSARDLNARLSDESFTVVRCRCSMAFLSPAPVDPSRHYASDYEPHRDLGDGTRRRKGSQRLRRLELLVPGRLLDVGCGSGFDLLAMRDRGWQVAGVEMNAQAAGRARAQGLDVRAGGLDEARFPDGAFEAVTLFHVLEHLLDPVAIAREVARVLRPGGVMLAQVPNFGGMGARLFREYWYELDVPRHVNFFTPSTARRLVSGAGLKLASLRWIESAADFNRSLERWTGYRVRLRPMRTLLRQTIRMLNLFRTGDMLEILARKPG